VTTRASSRSVAAGSRRAQKVGERQVVELAVGDGSRSASPSIKRDAQRRRALDPRTRGREHLGALSRPDDLRSVASARAPPRPCGAGCDVEDPLARPRLHGVDEGRAPARVLA